MRRSTYFNNLAVVLIAVPVTAVAQAPAAAPAAVSAAPPVAGTLAPRGGVMTPQTIQLRPMTPLETEANAVWSLRAGLNVAALQCQFSPYLATVKTYNDLLKHHSAELAAAQATMVAHFKRYDKARALNSFDQYSTKIYNSYSTLDAQYAFCNAASAAGRGTLLLSKGGLGKYAIAQTPVLRTALTPGVAPGVTMLEPMPIFPVPEKP
ncbi:hypothetical protein [Glacieibacterium frigidum]|uniref:Uncharacterized protein n=1 Tax=Glacieibacterium frigidum TaxID=2593303 RepID=A0A552U7Z9_9SPHN|nr:hypothetical protein [Glacieibacterium frigidum]TRW14347.1 hypothetical protein FMM06_11590 [Glacieibacterium frigidum]